MMLGERTHMLTHLPFGHARGLCSFAHGAPTPPAPGFSRSVNLGSEGWIRGQAFSLPPCVTPASSGDHLLFSSAPPPGPHRW